MNSSDTPAAETPPSIFNYVLSFLLVGVAWGFTTPFIRRAAVDFNARNEQKAQTQKEQDAASSSSPSSWAMQKLLSLSRTAANLLRTPGYTVPLLLNLTGSVWFFLLVGKHELSLSVPITNSMAFLFTVLGEWCAEGKVISKSTWLGMFMVLGGIALCVHSKTQ
ncbi:integral membrane protein, putative [Histoplasma capsulatum G186AR]|uniref:Putative integral membrane protein n=1 Tax=Ajellomyces capsulatus TaxID=5037 RepID=A0A8H7YIJ2_AJECA|nr:putative integral membrane protein [Histoplasma capsulatum]QSS72327.1 integral membrane protein, putative [Histoplasma capsulatum G186AR]